MKNNLYRRGLTHKHDIYINYGDDQKMASFHLVNRQRPISDDYHDRVVRADLIVRG